MPRRSPTQSVIHVLGLVVLGGIAALLGLDAFRTPAPLGPHAPDDQFSAARALPLVQAVAPAPRPQGSEAAAAARAVVVERLEALGLEPEIQDVLQVRQHTGTDTVFVGRVVNVLARIPGRTPGSAVLLSAHTDSGPTGRGAGDCGACVATVLETAHALLAGPPLEHDVILLFPDGEETQLFGSRAFVERHPWARDVRVALNFEAQGMSGPTVFYVSSPDDARLADAVFRSARHAPAWSYLTELVREVVGASDLDSFFDGGHAGAGFAFFFEPQSYHTLRDSPERLDPSSLQHAGDLAVHVTRGIDALPAGALQAPQDAVYATLLRGVVLRYPASWVPFLTLLITGLAAARAWQARRRGVGLRSLAMAVTAWTAALVGVLALITAAWVGLRAAAPPLQVLLVGVTYGYTWLMIGVTALGGAGLLSVHAALVRRGSPEVARGGALVLWWGLLAVATGMAPSVTPVLAWPLLVALLAVGGAASTRPAAVWGAFALVTVTTALLMVPAAVLFQLLAGRMEAITGMPAMALPVLPLLLGSLLPIAFAPPSGWPTRHGVRALAGLGLGLLLVGLLRARFDVDHPRPNSVMYVRDADTGQARWLTTADPGWLRPAARDAWVDQVLGDEAVPAEVAPWSAAPALTRPGWAAPAPDRPLPAPRLEVVEDGIDGDVRRLVVLLRSPRGSDNLRMHVDQAPRALRVAGQDVPLAGLTASEGWWLQVLALPEAGLRVALDVPAGQPLEVGLEDWSPGLPEGTVPPRPPHMVPAIFDLADTTRVRTTIRLPPSPVQGA